MITLTNAVISADYLAIAAILLWSGRSLVRVGARRFYWLLSAFILSCGIGHGLEALGVEFAHDWHLTTAVISTGCLVGLTGIQAQLIKAASADYTNELIIDSYKDPIGLYKVVGDDMLILHQNPAAIAKLGKDMTGQMLGEAMPGHKITHPSQTRPLIEIYRESALSARPAEMDVYYPDNGAQGWYRIKIWPAGLEQILILWTDISSDRIGLENQIFLNQVKRAIMDREFVLHYQKIVDLSTNQVSGYEALIRWPRDDGSLRQPGEFLPLIEHTELMSSLCYLVIRMACEELRRWEDNPDRAHMHLAVNLSPLTVSGANFESMFNSIIDELDIDRKKLMLEITEQDALQAPIIPRLKRMRDLGHDIAIDDFGTGYSSLSALQRYPADLVKIDRSLIVDIANNEVNQNIVKTVLALAELLKLDAIAEGVEDASEAEWLSQVGVKYGQGYFWHKPEPLA